MGFCYPFSELGRLYLDPEIRLAILSLYEQLKIGKTAEQSEAYTNAPLIGTGIAFQSAVHSICLMGADALSRRGQVRTAGVANLVADVHLHNGVAFRVPIGSTHPVFAHTKDAVALPASRLAEISMCTDYQLAVLGRCLLHPRILCDPSLLCERGPSPPPVLRAYPSRPPPCPPTYRMHL